jgi:hypothetical protein
MEDECIKDEDIKEALEKKLKIIHKYQKMPVGETYKVYIMNESNIVLKKGPYHK